MPDEHPGLERVRRIVEKLEDEVRDINASLQGSSLSGPGLLSRLSHIEEEQRDLKEIVHGYEQAERRREAEVKAREQKRDRVFNLAIALLTIIVGGVVTQLILLYISGALGG